MQVFDFIGEQNVGTLFGIRDSRRYWRLNPLINFNNKDGNKHEKEDHFYFDCCFALCIGGVCVHCNGDRPLDSMHWNMQVKAKTGFPETRQKGTVYDL